MADRDDISGRKMRAGGEIIIAGGDELGIDELASLCNMPRQSIIAYVTEGIIEVQGGRGAEPGQWRFSRLTMLRLRRACRLEHDLGLNPPGIALALELLERIGQLQSRLARLEQRNDDDEAV